MSLLTPALFFAAVSLALGVYCLLSLRTDGWRRWAGPGLLGVLLIGGVLVMSQTLGRPIPTWASVTGLKGDVVGVHLVEGEAIYLWVVPPGDTLPVAIQLPWLLEEAKKIYKMVEEGQPIEYESGNYEKPVHPKPVEVMPPKE